MFVCLDPYARFELDIMLEFVSVRVTVQYHGEC